MEEEQPVRAVSQRAIRKTKWWSVILNTFYGIRNKFFRSKKLGECSSKRDTTSRSSDDESSSGAPRRNTVPAQRTRNTPAATVPNSNNVGRPMMPARQSRRSLAAARRKPLKFIKNDKRRTELAKDRGSTLVKKAEEMAARTGARVYLKTQYISKTGRLYTFTYGEDFTACTACGNCNDSDQRETVETNQMQTTQERTQQNAVAGS